MFRLADKGLSVVGAEFSEMAVEEFFQEHSLEYTKEEVPANTDIKLFKVIIHMFGLMKQTFKVCLKI